MNTSVKKYLVVLVALLLCFSVVFAACNSGNTFTPAESVTNPGGAAEGNGGAAVKYGDYVYYVNGNQTSVDADNEYTNDIRVGSIIRVKASDIDTFIQIAEDNKDSDLSSTEVKKQIAKSVRSKAVVVVPNFYYSANTTTPSINGIYIFDGRIYVTTPNNDLTAGGDSLTSQLVLKSYALDGSDAKSHFIFTSNSTQIMLSCKDGAVYATALIDSALHNIKLGDTVKASQDVTVAESASNVTFEKATASVYYTDGKSNLCIYTAADAEGKVVLNNEQLEEGEDHEGHNHARYTYTVKSVNSGDVFYTKADSKDSTWDNLQLYKVSASKPNVEEVVAKALPSGSYFGYGAGVLYVQTVTVGSDSLYGLALTTDGSAASKKVVLSAAQNDKSITLNKLEGSVLYYTANSVYYSVDLSAATYTHTPLAYSLDSSTSVWYQPAIIGNYVFTLSSGGISVVKFNPETKTNSESVSILLTVEETEA